MRLGVSPQELRFYLQTAVRYAEIALDDGADPDDVFLAVWGQLENFRIAHIDRADTDTVRWAEREHYADLAADLAQGLAELIKVTGGDAPPQDTVEAIEAMATELLELYTEAEKRAPSGRNSTEEGEPLGPASAVSRYADARTLLETTDGAEFGLTDEPREVVHRASTPAPLTSSTSSLPGVRARFGCATAWSVPCARTPGRQRAGGRRSEGARDRAGDRP